MILMRMLDHDLHRSRETGRTVLMLETPAKPDFVPAVVSTIDSGRFLVARKLTKESRLRSAVFQHDPDAIDSVVPSLVKAAYDLSVSEKWENLFPNDPKKAFEFIAKNSGLKIQPHMCLIPDSWKPAKVHRFFGKANVKDDTYNGVSKIVPVGIPCPVFLSRPDYVGMYTQIVGGYASIVLHNVRLGMAFCPDA